MKTIIENLLLCGLLLSVSTLHCQDITGQWHAVLNISGASLRLVFHINQTDDGYQSSLDSPDQGAFGIPATTTFDGKNIVFAVSSIGMVYEGEITADGIAGTFTQGAISMPMPLRRNPADLTPPNRPQEPKPPFPYRTEEVKFENPSAGVTLAGTLTFPKRGNNFPAVILISGSGPQDRNEEIMGHKPFLVIADYLTRAGIAVLRYDDRGVGLSSGDFATATTADHATDVESAIDFLKTRNRINPKKIGLIGHSEGGIIAPLVASQSDDVAFIVLLAGTGVRGDQLLLKQSELLSRAAGLTDDVISSNISLNEKIYQYVLNTTETLPQTDIAEFLLSLKEDITKIVPPDMIDDFITSTATQISNIWLQYFIRHDPAIALQSVTCPVLAVNGSNDLQVSPTQNLPTIRETLEKSGNRQVTTKEYAGLNHLFQTCPTGLPANYGVIEETFSTEVLRDMTEWIKEVIK